MLLFSTERLQISALRSPCQVALPTEAWQGAEILRCSAENGYVNLPVPVQGQILVYDCQV